MIVHFPNEAAAVAHLKAYHFALVEQTGFWVSKDGTCKASIHPVMPGSDIFTYVALCVQEV